MNDNTRLILAGVDLGPRSAAVLACAWDLACSTRGRLAVVHCLDPRELGAVGESARALISELDSRLAERLARLERLCAEGGRQVHAVRVDPGEPVSGLLRVIDEYRPEMVVLGGRQRRLLPLCGVSERLSHVSPAPVVLVPWTRPVAPPALALRQIRPEGRLRLVK